MTGLAFDEVGVDLLRRVLYAASKDDARPILETASFSGREVVTTDAYRMAIGYFDGPEFPELMLDAGELGRQLPKSGGYEVNGEVPRPQGAYPTWRKIVRGLRWAFSYSVSRGELAAALTTLPKVGRHEMPIAQLSGAGVQIGHRPDGSSGNEWSEPRAHVKHVGAVEPVAFNALFLRDLVKNSRAETLTFDCEASLRPSLVREPGMSHLLMPVRVS